MVDILIIGILLVSGIIAVSRGFVREALGILSWIVATFAALYGYPYFAPLFEDFIDNKTITEVVAGVSISIVVLVVCTFITSAIHRRIKESCLKGLDSILGFIFGLVRGWLIILLLYVLGLIIFPAELYNQQKASNTLPYVAQSFAVLEKVMPSELNDEISKRIDEAEKQAEKKEKEEKTSIVPKPKGRDGAKLGYDKKDREKLDKLIGGVLDSFDDADSAEQNASKKEKVNPWAKSETSVGKADEEETEPETADDESEEDEDE